MREDARKSASSKQTQAKETASKIRFKNFINSSWRHTTLNHPVVRGNPSALQPPARESGCELIRAWYIFERHGAKIRLLANPASDRSIKASWAESILHQRRSNNGNPTYDRRERSRAVGKRQHLSRSPSAVTFVPVESLVWLADTRRGRSIRVPLPSTCVRSDILPGQAGLKRTHSSNEVQEEKKQRDIQDGTSIGIKTIKLWKAGWRRRWGNQNHPTVIQ